MEQTAVQLMSRKQRAAKLLTGDIGLTGLDALTEGEGGFEEALLEAIGRDETLFDPSQLFKATSAVSEIDMEDAGYWNVEGATALVDEPMQDEADPLITLALEMGATITSIDEPTKKALPDAEASLRPVEAVTAYLETVHLIADETAWVKLRAKLLMMLDGSTTEQITAWLTEHRVVFPGCEAEVAAKVVSLVGGQGETTLVAPTVKSSRIVPSKRKRETERQPLVFPHREAVYEEALTQQLALF
ncbi:MAG: hypothetical protein H7Z43_12080 [Clostridia bacterium]|nr:hypothetical protein [Deltaproteobacteria bacterium]